MGKPIKNEYISQIQIKRIRECMKEFGIKNKDLAEKLNYTQQHISYILNGKRTLTVELAILLADTFNQYLSRKTYLIKVPYNKLSESEKLQYSEDEIEDGFVHVPFDDIDGIDYRYLLGEVDFKTKWENFETPEELNVDKLFKTGVESILHYYGYDMELNMCPDITTFRDLKADSAFNGMLKSFLMNPSYSNKLIEVASGKTLTLLPSEMYQLFHDFAKSIVSIVERRFEEKQWYDNLLSEQPTVEEDNSLKLDLPTEEVLKDSP